MENGRPKKKPPLSRRRKNKGNSLTLLQNQQTSKIDMVSIFIIIQHDFFLNDKFIYYI